MGIPIYLSAKPHTQILSRAEAPCPRCGKIMPHDVVRRYTTGYLYGLPTYSIGVEYLYTCPSCRTQTSGPRPAGARPMPFVHRFGWALLFGIPALLTVGVVLIRQVQQDRYRARHEEDVRLHEEVAAAAKVAEGQAEATTKKCLEDVRRGIAKAVPRTLADLTPLKPADPGALAGTPFILPPTSDYRHKLQVPEGRLFGGPPCAIEVPKDVHMYARGLTGGAVDPHEVQALTRALAEKVGKITAPSVAGITDYTCQSTKQDGKTCIGVAAWISLADGRPVAVARVTTNVLALDDTLNGEMVARSLSVEAKKW